MVAKSAGEILIDLVMRLDTHVDTKATWSGFMESCMQRIDKLSRGRSTQASSMQLARMVHLLSRFLHRVRGRVCVLDEHHT